MRCEQPHCHRAIEPSHTTYMVNAKPACNQCWEDDQRRKQQDRFKQQHRKTIDDDGWDGR